MEDWSECDGSLLNDGLEHSMTLVQRINSQVAETRERMGSKRRWPLKAICIRGTDTAVDEAVKVFDGILLQQANIKSLEYLGPGESPAFEAEPVDFGEGEFWVDPEVTPEIEAEGWSRDLIRRIQQMRKDMKLDVEEYIVCDVKADEHLTALFASWKDGICREVRAKELNFTDSPSGDKVVDWDISGSGITVGVSSTRI